MEAWSRKKYQMDYDRMMYLYELAEYPENGLKSIEEEIDFWHRYYACLLREEGIEDDVEGKAEFIFQHIWLKERMLYPEVVEILKTLKKEGFKLGVISDTTPSLQLTLESLGIGEYFDCYISSDCAGSMKPESKIYQAALDALCVSAEESIYVDDSEIDAKGARELGLTSFHLKREEDGTQLKGSQKDYWTIDSLQQIVDFLHKE